MENSLLAHLFPYFKGSQEDVATCSLNYIISSNINITNAFNELVKRVLCLDEVAIKQYKCQVVGNGKEKERPDMAGFNENGDEVILCESKFYASLTINQPNTYLSRLIDEKGKGLIFICPQIRLNGLWKEIKELASKQFDVIDVSEICLDICGVKMGIVTWNEIINSLETTAISLAPDSLSDIKQLSGYCSQLDSEAFIPFVDEDFGIDNAIKIQRHYDLLDNIVNEIKHDKTIHVNLGRLHATPQRTGYSRYMYIDGWGVTLDYNTNLWKNPASPNTPYWLNISRISNSPKEKWVFDDVCEKALHCISPDIVFENNIAIFAPKYVAINEVTSSMISQIKEVINIFNETEKAIND